MNEIKDPIALALNCAPIPAEAQSQLPALPANTSVSADTSDIDIAQSNLKELHEKGIQALASIMEVAELSQHPRAFEVVATTIATLAEVNSKMVQNLKTKRDLGAAADPQNSAKTVHNQNLFVGSTAELMKLLEGARGRSS